MTNKKSIANLLKQLERRKKEYYEKVTNDICDKCDLELQRIKRYKPLSILSRYRKKHEVDYQPPFSGFSLNDLPDPTYVGEINDWLEAFERFKNKTVNIYGQKTNRTKMFDDMKMTKVFNYGDNE
jgi:hypothetical protein